VLYWGGRQWADLYAVDSVAAWEAQHPGIRLVPVLSEAGPEWTGRRGFVHAAVLEDLPDLSAHEVYACGNPLMIDAARSSFTATAGLPAERFLADAFVVNN
jgi:CDP-4-dehydro-6-deoxyglucose reductase